MKTLLKCDATVSNGDLVEFSGAGTVQRYTNGQLAGVATERRDVQIIDPDTQETTVAHVVVVSRFGTVRANLVGGCDANGGEAFINGYAISSTGAVKIGLIEPRPYPETNSFSDELVNVYVEF